MNPRRSGAATVLLRAQKSLQLAQEVLRVISQIVVRLLGYLPHVAHLLVGHHLADLPNLVGVPDLAFAHLVRLQSLDKALVEVEVGGPKTSSKFHPFSKFRGAPKNGRSGTLGIMAPLSHLGLSSLLLVA